MQNSRVTPPHVKKSWIFIASVTTVLMGAVVISGLLFAHSSLNPIPRLIYDAVQTPVVFPDTDSQNLTPSQRRLIEILHEQYEHPQPATFYSEGVNEAWCANFASWVMKKYGEPYVNPYSKSWRIPGTITLREYYQSTGKFVSLDQQYSPQPGDVVFYDNPSVFGQHVNFVLANDNGELTTIGGNEAGKIRVSKSYEKAEGVLGFGRL